MKNRILTAIIALSFVPATALAQYQNSSSVQGSGPSPYLECGIGAALFPDTAWAAVTSNAIWDLGSTAITSALSSPEQCNAKKMQTAKLILETLPNMEKDVAMGEGKYLNALVATAGCDAASTPAIASQMRSSYATSVGNADYATQSRTERATNLYFNAKAAMAASQCTTVL